MSIDPLAPGRDGGRCGIATVGTALQSRAWEVVVIGRGVRNAEEPAELFESVVNLVRQLAPSAAIAFNRTPTETFDAAARWLDRNSTDSGAAG